MPQKRRNRNDERLFKELNNIGIALSNETDIDLLLELILEKAKHISNADNGTLYLLTRTDKLKFMIMRSTSLDINWGGRSKHRIPFASIPLYDKAKKQNNKRIVVCAALKRESINVSDIYSDSEYDFSGTKAFDKRKKYKSVSVLAVPLTNNQGEILGVLHLVNAQNRNKKIIPFSKEIEHIIESLASQASVALEKQRLIQEQKSLLDGIIRMIALAIDAKSSHTSNHCQAIPVIVELIAKAACKQKSGYFKEFELSESDWYELKVAAWLHDCGKLTTPVHLLDKSTKLYLVQDCIEHISNRMEILARDYEIQKLKKNMTAGQYRKNINILKDDIIFLTKLNKGTESVSPKKLERLSHIAEYTWTPKLQKIKRPKAFFTKEEYKNLSVTRGTLNSDERTIINQHMDVTIDMLESLPLPKHLKRVPEYAGGHHERMDGRGFPKGLTRDQMSIPARMMAVADIFEALTSHDRPYKRPNTLSEALSIMKKMVENQHIDPDIFELFVKEKTYLKYAKKFLLPEQIDMP